MSVGPDGDGAASWSPMRVPGCPRDEREQVFTRFYRGSGDAVVQTRGVGIGLSVVAELVARMHGEVGVDDAPGAAPGSRCGCPPPPHRRRGATMRRRLESLLPFLVLAGFLAAAVVVNLLAHQRPGPRPAGARGLDRRRGPGHRRQPEPAVPQHLRGHRRPVEPRRPVRPGGGQPRRPGRARGAAPAGARRAVRLLPPRCRGRHHAGRAAARRLGRAAVRVAGLRRAERVPDLRPGHRRRAAAVRRPDHRRSPSWPSCSRSSTRSPGPRRGAFVFESVVAADSDFNKEIGSLQRGDTGEYLFFDGTGGVIGSNDPSLLGRRLADERLIDLPVGRAPLQRPRRGAGRRACGRLAGRVPAGER